MGRIFIDYDLAEKRYIFTNRPHAGLVVARMLTKWRGRSDEAVVLAIPAGGVPVGLTMARALGLPFDLLFIRKLHFPDNPESGFGAVSEHGEVLLNERLARLLDRKTIERQIVIEKEALEIRIRRLRRLHPAMNLTGRTAIVTDDGLASGFTMLAAIAEARARGAASVIVAVPTASRQAAEKVADAADALYVANLRSGQWFAVADAYTDWRDLSLEEVEEMLEQRP